MSYTKGTVCLQYNGTIIPILSNTSGLRGTRPSIVILTTIAKEGLTLLPNFLIIGAPRSGTTHLYKGLRQHPEVYLSDFKEPMFFAYENDPRPSVISDLKPYEALFEPAARERAVGEASTLYLYSKRAAKSIAHYIPKARLIAVLRNPIDRAFSQYTFQRLLKDEPYDSFEEALLAEETRRTELSIHMPFTLYREVGLYSEQIRRYQQLFPPDQLLFVLQDDLDQHPQQVFQTIFSFLGVNDTFQPNLPRRTNASGVPEHQTLFHLIKSTGRAIKRFVPESTANRWSGQAHETLLSHPLINETTRVSLQNFFREDIERTGTLIGRDLSHWIDASSMK